MSPVRSIGHLVLVVLVVAGMTVPAAAVSIGLNSSESTASLDSQSAVSQNNSSVNVTVGQQLSTIITASSDEVQTEFENTAFELSYEREGEEGKAEAIADRAEELRERAADIREDYREATEEYEAGEISKSQYAQRLATLNARATNVLESYELLRQRAANVSALELRAAGMNQSALQNAIENLSSVSGTGAAALLKQYTGESEGEIELETAGGLSIEIESEDGEESREIERPRDDDQNITVNQSVALDTARAALSTPAIGSWVLVESKVKQGEGAYEFAFRLEGDANRTGDAEVLVDGSSGTVFKLEEEIEPLGDEEDEEDEQDADEEDHEGELALIVTEGTPAPNATITLQVLADGEPTENVTVDLNDQAVGQSGPDGTISVTLPASGDVELTAETEEAEGELKIEFEEDDEQDEVFEHLNVEATLDDDTVTVAVTFNGSSVRNATVYANDERVGTTDASGTVTFTIDTTATEELELEVVKGQFEAELAYAIQDGSLVLTEEEHEGDGDKAEQEDEEGDEQEDDEGDDEDEVEEGEDDGSLSMAVAQGTPEPGATITVEVLSDGTPVEGASVSLNGDDIGTTDANGTLEVTLPSDEDSIELRAEHGDADGRLEFEFDESEETETETEEG